MPTATISRKISCDGWVETISKQVTGDAWDTVEASIGASDVDTQVDIAIDISQIVAILVACKESDLVLEANAAASAGADYTINLDEDIALLWLKEDGDNGRYDNPFAVDTTKFFVTNTGGVAGTLLIGLLRDATP